MSDEKWIKEQVKDMTIAFCRKNGKRLDLVSQEVKRAMFFKFCFSVSVLKTWSNEALVQLHGEVEKVF